jgi:hypothetical protein
VKDRKTHSPTGGCEKEVPRRAMMSDAELYDETEDLTDAPEDTEQEAAEETQSKKDPLPEGYLTPVGFTKLLAEPVDEGGRGTEIRPQQVYGYARNNKQFKEDVVEEHTDGRVILNVEAALAWWDAKEERKAERAAKKEAAEAAAAESSDEDE